jgi:hypothetical protein
MGLQTLLFKRNSNIEVDMRELASERENLMSFLRTHFRLHSTLSDSGLAVNREDTSPQELTRMVTKFVYHKNLNTTHFVAQDNNTIKISKFKHQKEKKKNKNPLTASTIKHGW